MIQISGLRKAFGARDLFRDASLRLGARDRLALVGPNGSGKTTLLEMIVGIQEPDGGRIDVARGITMGTLAQHTEALRGHSAIEEVLSAGSPVADARHRLGVLTHELEDADPGERDALLAEFARLQDRFATLGGYSLEAQARRICAGLGFRDEDLDRRTEELSGGWLMRIALAKLLLAAPDLLLLDEPTNHLDLESVRWLESFLSTFDGAVLLVSHDRDFMNGFATRVVEIDRAQLVAYSGNYAAFVDQREMRIRQAEAAAAQQQRRVAQLEKFINRFRYKESKARQVQSKIKYLERIDRVDVGREKRRAMNTTLPSAPRAARVALELDRVEFAYGGRPVYRGLDLVVERGQKIALVGPNGAGKSTLLKLLAGVLEPQAGERRVGERVELGYFAQHAIDALDMNVRVIEEVERVLPPGGPIRPRALLGRFLFSGEDVDKPVRVLSGGERTRLAMAKLLASTRNVLCLDEPTNHLDIWSRDALEDALEEFDGAIVLITHDRHLIRSIASTIVEVIGGRVRIFHEDYETYLERIESEAGAAEIPAHSGAHGSAPAAGASIPARERRRAAAAERARTNVRRNSIRAIERELDAIHAELAGMNTRMAAADFYTTEPDPPAFMRRYEERRARVAELEQAWDGLTETDSSAGGPHD